MWAGAEGIGGHAVEVGPSNGKQGTAHALVLSSLLVVLPLLHHQAGWLAGWMAGEVRR